LTSEGRRLSQAWDSEQLTIILILAEMVYDVPSPFFLLPPVQGCIWQYAGFLPAPCYGCPACGKATFCYGSVSCGKPALCYRTRAYGKPALCYRSRAYGKPASCYGSLACGKPAFCAQGSVSVHCFSLFFHHMRRVLFLYANKKRWYSIAVWFLGCMIDNLRRSISR
jgi:hypothetical protein